MRSLSLIGMLLLVLVVLPGAVRGDDAPPTVTVTRGPFQSVAEFAGAFDGTGTTEIRWEPQVFSGTVDVVDAVSAGPVEKGRRLVRVDPEPLDDAIAEAERSLIAARAALDAMEAEAARRDEASALAMEQAREDARVAAESLRIYRDVEMPLRLEEADQGLKSSRDRIEDQAEELAQLEKMYGADDLTEETEEIVLRRARRDLAQSKQWYDFRMRRDRLMREVELPRELRSREFAARRSAMDLDRLEATRQPSLERARVEVEKARAALAIQERQFARLRADREALEIAAPVAGLAVPAELVRGKWVGLDEGMKAMRKGGKLRPGAVVFTIVQAGAVEVVTSVPEAQLRQMKEGLEAVVVPTADPAAKLAATVIRVARFSAGTDYEVRLRLSAEDARLLPGQTCRAKVTCAEKPDALTVPSGAIRVDGGKSFVYLVVEGKTTRTEVVVGTKSGDLTEVLSGVSEGDVLLRTPPEKE